MVTSSRSAINCTKKSIIKFEKFCQAIHHKTKDEVISELKILDSNKKDQVSLEMLQDYVNFLSHDLAPSSIHAYFAYFKKYLKYMTNSKLHSEDIKEEIKIPKIIEEEGYPLKREQIKELLKNAKLIRQAFYLTSLSSGMREQEMCKLRKRDFDDSLARIMVRIPGKYTKTKKPRKTFISSEAAKYLKPILDKKGMDDLVFGTNESSEVSAFNEIGAFKLVRKKAGLDHLRYDSGMHKVTIHSFRSFFITQAEKVNEGLGHALAGHNRYMARYERYDEKELLEFYLKIESNLLIFEAPPSEDTKILNEKMLEQDKKIQELETRLQQRAERSAKFAKQIRDQNRLIGSMEKRMADLEKKKKD